MKIRQLIHKPTRQIFDIDTYDIVKIRNFCIDMAKALPEEDETRKLYLEKLEKMSHIEILAHLEEQGFECLELDVEKKEKDTEREEWENNNK